MPTACLKSVQYVNLLCKFMQIYIDWSSTLPPPPTKCNGSSLGITAYSMVRNGLLSNIKWHSLIVFKVKHLPNTCLGYQLIKTVHNVGVWSIQWNLWRDDWNETNLWWETIFVVTWPYIFIHLYLQWQNPCYIRPLSVVL